MVDFSQFKYKIINYATTMTLSTVLGPRYEHPVCWMQLISKKVENDELQYLVFATKNVIGLQKMCLDGNPWKHVGLLAHPVQVKYFGCSTTEKFLCFVSSSSTILYPLFTLREK